MNAEIIANGITCRIEPWIGPEPGEEAFFNAATARVNDHIVLMGRIAREKAKFGMPDLTPFVGIALENGLGVAKRVKELDLRERLRRLGIYNIEDYRFGPVEENGSAFAGVTVIMKGRSGYQVFPGISKVYNLDNPEEIRIDDPAILKENGKGTLITSKTSDPAIEGYYRGDEEKFNHVFAHFSLNQWDGNYSVTYEPIDAPKWGSAKLGLAGLPIKLEPEGTERSRQLFTLHGSRRRSYTDWEYGLGRALRIVDSQGNVRWNVEKEAIILPISGENPQERFSNKKIVYSTGQVVVKDGEVIMAVTYGDFGVAKATFDYKEFVAVPPLTRKAA